MSAEQKGQGSEKKERGTRKASTAKRRAAETASANREKGLTQKFTNKPRKSHPVASTGHADSKAEVVRRGGHCTRSRYLWEEWLERGRFSLQKGKDFVCPVVSIMQQARNAANVRGYKISVSRIVEEETVTVDIMVTGKTERHPDNGGKVRGTSGRGRPKNSAKTMAMTAGLIVKTEEPKTDLPSSPE